MSKKPTKISVILRVFDKDHPKIEIDTELERDPPLELILRIILDRLHEATGKDGEELKYEGEHKIERIFNTILFQEIQIDRGGPMILYKWKRKTLANAKEKQIFFSEYGEYIMTKSILG